MSREMKDSGVEWIGKIPKSWEMYPIKGILHERKENNDPIKTKEILSLTIEQGVIPHSEKIGVGGNKPKEDLSKYRLAYPGDIVVNSMNILAGAVGLSKYFGAVSPVYYTLYPSSEEFSREFVTHVFKSKEFQDNLLGLGNGIMMKKSESSGKLNTIRMRIPMSKLNTQYLPMPPIEVQKKITNHLKIIEDRIDSLISKTRNTIEDYKLLKQSIITEAVTKGLDKNVEMKDSGIEWIGDIPMSWKVVSSSSIFSNSKEKAVLEDEKLSATQSHGVLPQKLFEELVGRQVVSVSKNYENLKKVCENDFVISLRSFQGGIEMSRYNGAISAAYTILKPNKDVNPEFFKFLFKSVAFIQAIQSTIIESVREGKAISFSDFKLIKLPLLSFEEQTDIAEYLDITENKIDKLIEKKERLVSELEIYKKSLIYEYVTGKKEVE